MPSDFRQLFFFLFRNLVDFLDEVIRQLLNILFGDLVIIFRDLRTLLLFFQLLDRIPADVADGNLALLPILAGLLGKILAAFFGKRREDQADASAIILRIDSQVRGKNRPFDSLQQAVVPGLNQE